jgi:aspartyl-tRNA(Asn)/glutamyl-tRNA(Gln) amidotransferase subunit C
MAISRADVLKVSLLARLQLSDDELDTMTQQLSQIVGYVDQLSELNTDDVEPMAHALDVSNVFADDVVVDSLAREASLANSPHHDGESFLVPAVLGH